MESKFNSDHWNVGAWRCVSYVPVVIVCLVHKNRCTSHMNYIHTHKHEQTHARTHTHKRWYLHDATIQHLQPFSPNVKLLVNAIKQKWNNDMASHWRIEWNVFTHLFVMPFQKIQPEIGKKLFKTWTSSIEHWDPQLWPTLTKKKWNLWRRRTHRHTGIKPNSRRCF